MVRPFQAISYASFFVPYIIVYIVEDTTTLSNYTANSTHVVDRGARCNGTTLNGLHDAILTLGRKSGRELPCEHGEARAGA